MSERRQRIWAPVIILIVLVLLWEALVTAFDIQQFLLPKPSAIVGNLLQVVVIDASAPIGEADETEETSLRSRFLVFLTAALPPEEQAELEEALLLRIPLGRRSVSVLRGGNLSPILAASWFTLKEALGGLALGTLAGIAVALATTRWAASREALLPFAIAANSMPIIAFAPIMNNWFGIDNPFSKMAIVTIMIFFPYHDQYSARADFGRSALARADALVRGQRCRDSPQAARSQRAALALQRAEGRRGSCHDRRDRGRVLSEGRASLLAFSSPRRPRCFVLRRPGPQFSSPVSWALLSISLF